MAFRSWSDGPSPAAIDRGGRPPSDLSWIKNRRGLVTGGHDQTLIGLDLEPDPKAAPVAAVDRNRCRNVFQKNECSSAHVAAVGLQKKWPLILAGRKPGAVVENPSIAAIGGVPDRVRTLRL